MSLKTRFITLTALGLLVLVAFSGVLPAAHAQSSPSVAVSLSDTSVEQGTAITATMSFRGLAFDSDTSTTDYTFRADVTGASECEGNGLGRTRYMYRVDDDPEVRTGTVSASCPAGDYTIRATISTPQSVALASATASFTVAAPAQEPTASPTASIALSPSDAVGEGAEITATMSFGGLASDSDASTTDYVFRADVVDADDCEGGGIGFDRYMYRVDDDPETRTGTVSANCPAGAYTLRVSISSADNTELASASADFFILGAPVLIEPPTLTALSVSHGDPAVDVTLSPAFASETLEYDADVTVAQVTVAPTTSDADATVAYLDENGDAIADADEGADGHQVDLEAGSNTVKVAVSKDSLATTYTVNLLRLVSAQQTASQCVPADPANCPTVQLKPSLREATLTLSGSPTGSYEVRYWNYESRAEGIRTLPAGGITVSFPPSFVDQRHVSVDGLPRDVQVHWFSSRQLPGGAWSSWTPVFTDVVPGSTNVGPGVLADEPPSGAPSEPRNLRVSSHSTHGGTAVLQWDSPASRFDSGTGQFEVLINQRTLYETGTADRYTHIPLREGSVRSFHVRARNASGAGPWAGPVRFVADREDASYPRMPKGFTAYPRASGQVFMNWHLPDAGDGVTGYRIVRVAGWDEMMDYRGFPLDDVTVVATERNGVADNPRALSKEFNLDSQNGAARGVWSNGTTIWVADASDNKLYAHTLVNGARHTGNDIALHSDNGDPTGIWSDGTTVWVADFGDDQLYAYALEGGKRQDGTDGTTDREFDLHSDNTHARGVWSDGTTVWVADSGDDQLYAYALAGGKRQDGTDGTTDREFDLDSGHADVRGIWSDGTTIWGMEPSGNTLYAYALDGGKRQDGTDGTTDRELDLHSDNSGAWGIWSDRKTMWVANIPVGIGSYRKVYAYYMLPTVTEHVDTSASVNTEYRYAVQWIKAGATPSDDIYSALSFIYRVTTNP